MVTLPTASVIVSVMISSEPEPDLTQAICESSTVAVPDVGQVFVSVTSQFVPNMLSTNCLDKLAYILYSTFLINLLMVVLFVLLSSAAASDRACFLLSSFLVFCNWSIDKTCCE